MTKFSQKRLRALVEAGAAEDLSTAEKTARLEEIVAEGVCEIGYAESVYGCAGKLLKSLKDDRLYTIVGRVGNLFVL